MLCAHYDNAAALYRLVPLYIHSEDGPWLQKRGGLVFLQSWYFGLLCGVRAKVCAVTETLPCMMLARL